MSNSQTDPKYLSSTSTYLNYYHLIAQPLFVDSKIKIKVQFADKPKLLVLTYLNYYHLIARPLTVSSKYEILFSNYYICVMI